MSKKISQLEEKLELTGDEYLVLQDGTENRKAKASLLKGQKGDKGDKGDTGDAGPAGPAGEQGPQGPAGPQGATGDTGPQGPQGEKGDTGAQGPQGPAGEDGQDGASGIPSVVDHGTNDTTFALTPNVFHRWGEVATLNLTLGAETAGVLNEYMAQFTSGTTATVLTLPDTVTYIGESTIEADKTYQVSIINNLAVLGGA